MSKKKEMEKDASLHNQEITPSAFHVIVREFRKDKLATFSLAVLTIIILTVFIGSLFFDVEEVMKVNLMDSFLRPGEEGYLLGTDQAGRSLLAAHRLKASEYIAGILPPNSSRTVSDFCKKAILCFNIPGFITL